VTPELPGIDEKDIKVKLSHRVLTIKGGKEAGKGGEEKRIGYFSETSLWLIPATS
jgi:HSP20 family molecular chaperone IbpA